MNFENQTFREGITFRNCEFLIKQGKTGLVVEYCTFTSQPPWKHPIQRLKFWRKWRLA